MSGGRVRLHRPGAGLPLPSMAIHDGVYSTLEDEYRDRERGGNGWNEARGRQDRYTPIASAHEHAARHPE